MLSVQRSALVVRWQALLSKLICFLIYGNKVIIACATSSPCAVTSGVPLLALLPAVFFWSHLSPTQAYLCAFWSCCVTDVGEVQHAVVAALSCEIAAVVWAVCSAPSVSAEV